MPALVENMFYVRETPWHGQGTRVEEAPSSFEAIRLAGLNWEVVQQKLYTEKGVEAPDHFANVRTSDNKLLGVVGNRYSVVQNADAFSFTDALLGEGVKYETAGSLKDGRIIWLLARLPKQYEVLGDKVDPFVVFTNTHDGSGSVRVAMTPVRVVCNNTLNMALSNAKRTWSARHTGSIKNKLDEAMQTLTLAEDYMKATQSTFEQLYKVKLDEFSVRSMINNIVPIRPDTTKKQEENQKLIRKDILTRFYEAPDLKVLEPTGARLVQAVADSVDHMNPIRKTKNFAENRFKKALDGNDLLDKTVSILLSA